MKKLFVCLSLGMGLLMCLAGPAGAGCTKWAYGTITIYLEYQGRDADSISRVKLELPDYVKRSGHYGGGCRTHVGREKARTRAEAAVWKSARADFDKNWFAQAALVCRLAKRRDTEFTRSFYRRAENADWMRVAKFKMKVGFKEGKRWGGGKLTYPSIKAQPTRFLCTNLQPRMVND